ncbi:hypothetical protein AMECASPLE_017117 [Ameca splendens]|uniref:Uncharacterized protein n=1 Tax=Ameca splendens TaxID=208324 RepID=A0ABV0YQQ4_9TELE
MFLRTPERNPLYVLEKPAAHTGFTLPPLQPPPRPSAPTPLPPPQSTENTDEISRYPSFAANFFTAFNFQDHENMSFRILFRRKILHYHDNTQRKKRLSSPVPLRPEAVSERPPPQHFYALRRERAFSRKSGPSCFRPNSAHLCC